MAAGKFIVYKTGYKNIKEGNIDLEGGTIKAIPLHRGYTPSTASDSALSDIINFQSTASGTVVNAIALTGLAVTGSGAAAIKFDANDIAGFSAGGDTFDSKYIGLYEESASVGGVDNLLIGFLDTNSGVTTGVEGTQVNVTWPSGGIFKTTVNP